MLTLLSPAKSLDFSPAPDGLRTTAPRFADDTAVLMKRCKKLTVPALRKLEVSEEQILSMTVDNPRRSFERQASY